MCGIAVACGPDLAELTEAVAAMCAQMIARGPDAGGLALLGRDGAAAVLGNRRLAIIDPSPAGHQPMSDPERGNAITFNGMVYNFRDLRDRLAAEGERFVSECDTEVVLRAYGRYGPDCVRHLRGMFAFAIWDERHGRLFLARDRLGIKPLYYWHDGRRLLCASQVKALLASGLVPARLSPAGIRTYLACGAVSEPWTAIDGVLALPAAHRATFRGGRLELDRYWEPPSASERSLTREEAAAHLRRLLEDSVRRHLVSDAPLGVFLSGGLDSSIVAALAASAAGELMTLSVVFDDASLSEARYAALVARQIGSQHVEVALQPADLLAMLPDAFRAMDQPTFDGVNTFVVARAARDAGLKVALSGLGADELFDGYGNVRRVAWLERARNLPVPLAKLAGRAAGIGLRGSRGDKVREWLSGEAERGASHELLRRLFAARDIGRLVSAPVEGDGLARPARIDAGGELFNQVCVLELTNYLKNVLLRDTDAMGMASSIEVRVPYLDDPLVEWVLGLPARLKDGGAKALLAAAAGDAVPQEITARLKQGFLLPLASWMRNELRGEVDATLRRPPRALAEVLRPEAVAELWDAHGRDGSRWLQSWALYALCRWAETIDAPAPARELLGAR